MLKVRFLWRQLNELEVFGFGGWLELDFFNNDANVIFTKYTSFQNRRDYNTISTLWGFYISDAFLTNEEKWGSFKSDEKSMLNCFQVLLLALVYNRKVIKTVMAYRILSNTEGTSGRLLFI